jgi:hypothetical protein
MPDFSKTKIFYIPFGNTGIREYRYSVCNLRSIWSQHAIGLVNRNYRYDLYKRMFAAGLRTKDDVRIVWVEDFPCEHQGQARERVALLQQEYDKDMVFVEPPNPKHKVTNWMFRFDDKQVYRGSKTQELEQYHKHLQVLRLSREARRARIRDEPVPEFSVVRDEGVKKRLGF